MLLRMSHKSPFGAHRHLCASASEPHLVRSELSPMDPFCKSLNFAFECFSEAPKAFAGAESLIATHPEIEIAVTDRKQTTGIHSNRNTFRVAPCLIPTRFSGGFSLHCAAFAAGLSLSSPHVRTRVLFSGSNKIRARAYFLPASFAIPSGTGTLLSCTINHLGRAI